MRKELAALFAMIANSAARSDFARETYWPCADRAFSSCALTASRLKLAPGCIGGNSIAVWATLAISYCTNWKRQNS